GRGSHRRSLETAARDKDGPIAERRRGVRPARRTEVAGDRPLSGRRIPQLTRSQGRLTVGLATSAREEHHSVRQQRSSMPPPWKVERATRRPLSGGRIVNFRDGPVVGTAGAPAGDQYAASQKARRGAR